MQGSKEFVRHRDQLTQFTSLEQYRMTVQPPGKSPIRTAVSIALVAILAIVAYAVMRDAEARASAKTAHRAIEKMSEEMESVPTDQDVHKLLGRDPDESGVGESAPGEDKIWVEEYRWKGVFRDFTLTVHYRDGETKTVEAIRLH